MLVSESVYHRVNWYVNYRYSNVYVMSVVINFVPLS